MENTEIENRVIAILKNTKITLYEAKGKMVEIVGEAEIAIKKQGIELEKLGLQKLPEIAETNNEIKELLEQIEKIGTEINELC